MTTQTIEQFADLGLEPTILKAIEEQGYTKPSPIQAQAIPPILEGRDVMAAAQTGTGKTAGFTLPILHRLAQGPKAGANQVRALILTPTRELAAQVAENVKSYSAHLSLSSAVIFGGVKINPQMMRLRRGTDVLVATPGRLLDLYQQNAVKFSELEVLVFDEADRMLDMGFIHDIRKILRFLPAQRQTLMFSATFSDEIRELAKSLVKNPVQVSVTPKNATAPTVTHLIHPCDKAKKPALLARLIKDGNWQQALVFSRTKHGANKLTKYLQEAGISAAAIHGNKSQGARTRALAEFKAGEIRILVATDIAARGLDIEQLPQVVNIDLPNVPEDYVHRIGRTGRAGATGKALSLVSADEITQLVDIERVIGRVIDREYMEGYEPVHEVPASPTPRAHKPKKPKKPKKPYGDNQRGANSPAGNKPRRPGGARNSGRTGSANANRGNANRGVASQSNSGSNNGGNRAS
ncbi:DEAD/DEAH box helicase [Marinagarivorans algicola]|uniref:DEAD/DEAH box helicase n=1 Tax=Marinagarivorans algicola TaxID=1513270 RepID=UPI0006B9DF9C|nr:DEAD/DEAH box helicase [Marinagarivorans algicola]